MNIEELKRLAEAVLKAYSGLSWQVTMVRNEHGVTHYHIRSHSEPGIAVIKDQYWEDDHIPPVDHYGYIQPDDHIDCDVFRVNIARLIAAANPAAILTLIAEIDSLRDEVNGLTGTLERVENERNNQILRNHNLMIELRESRRDNAITMGWLSDCRTASGDNGERMLPAFVEYLRGTKRQRDELLAAIKDARELVDDWGAYAPAYIQEKHDLAGDLDRLDAAIAKAEAQS